MWLESELSMLMMSDVSGAAVDMLVTKSGLWLRNTLLHFLVPFFLFHLWFYVSPIWLGGRFRPAVRAGIWSMLAVFLALQVVQLFFPIGRLGWVFLDNLFDVVIAGAGFLLAWTWAMGEVTP
ncbi:hypothetical protein J4E08_22260 [Sagittula sp. NFXS13]|uniref:hypothetical protein n=1 Tax=Sagittula sp. NFXS13 TaxID=2819095 RepID=UPI0032DF6C3B